MGINAVCELDDKTKEVNARMRCMKAQRAVEVLLSHMGEDPNRPGLKDTPARVAKMYREITGGYRETPEDIFTFFEPENYDQMILMRDIPLTSFCEHHLLPFVGKAHVGYLPNSKIVGLSKLARVVNLYARRLQVQERLTNQIADCLMHHLDPRGCMVVVEAEHLCMSLRGVQTPGTTTATSAVRGVFLDNRETRDEFLTLIKGGQ